MKILKLLVSATLLSTILIPLSAAAQQRQSAPEPLFYRNEFSVGYGAPTTSDVIFPLFKLLGTVATLGGYTERNLKTHGGLFAAYKYRFDRIASLGATFVYGNNTSDVWWSGDYWGKSRQNNYTFAVECDFRYLTRRVVNLYSTVGLAATYSTHKFTSADPNDQQLAPVCFVLPDIHVSLIGVKVGGYRFGGFAELGLGYKGILNFGMYVRF